MKEDERGEYIKYRIKSAFSTLEAAKVLAKNDFWNSCVNRFYYSVSYAVNALLVSKGIQSKSHTSTKNQ